MAEVESIWAVLAVLLPDKSADATMRSAGASNPKPRQQKLRYSADER
jgi:hypothetical protein